MTKADIVGRVVREFGYTKTESQNCVESIVGIIKTALASGEDLKIAGFGKFEVRQKRDRRGRNPQTGEAITIEARRIVTFKPSSLLREAINAGQSPR